jgi:hypothetical protein
LVLTPANAFIFHSSFFILQKNTTYSVSPVDDDSNSFKDNIFVNLKTCIMKMLQQIGQQLSRKEMKKLSGGSGCCAHQDGVAVCGLSRDQAINIAGQWAVQTGDNAYWCCASCASIGLEVNVS